MTYVESFDCDQIRVILCMEFDAHAPPAEVATLKSKFIDSPQTLHAVESTGTFDFMVEIAAPDMAWLNSWLKALAAPMAKLLARCEKSFVCKRFVRRPKNSVAIWVPTADGRQRVDSAAIDKLVANGDYVQVFSNGRKWLLHATMHALLDTLSSSQFVQLHRSLIVRCGFLDRLSHERRLWVAHLRDGTIERIARSHVAEVLQATHLATPQAPSSKRVRSGDSALLR